MTDGNLAALEAYHAERDLPECEDCDDENCTCAEDNANERGDDLLRLRNDE